MTHTIIIPTYKPKKEILPMLEQLEEINEDKIPIIATCMRASASTNRNYGLIGVETDIVIMIDDDITGFYPGWDRDLVQPFKDYNDIAMMSARLLKPDGSLGVMNNTKVDIISPLAEVKERILPSACVAFLNDGLMFDENFLGSGWEDTDFCLQLQKAYPSKKFYINNGVKVIHLNEMKGSAWSENKKYCLDKWKLKDGDV